MSGTVVLAGARNLGNEVRSVGVMEVPDIEGFVRSGSMLLTTAYPIHHDPGLLMKLAPVLHDKGLAALAIKIGRYIDALPTGLVELCDELGFPLLLVRDDLAFEAVIGEAMSLILTEDSETEASDPIRHHLTELALSGGGLHGIATVLAEAVSSEVTIVDEAGTALHFASNPSTDRTEEYGDQTQALVIESFDITIGHTVSGAIRIASPGPLNVRQQILARQAAFAAGLHIAQSRAAIEVNRRLQILALEELIAPKNSTSRDYQDSSFILAGDFQRLRQACVASYDPSLDPIRIEEEAKSIWGANSYSWVRGHNVVTVFDHESLPASVQDSLSSWQAVLATRILSPSAAVGKQVQDSKDLSSSYTTAMRAWQLAQRTGRQSVQYTDLEMELLLQTIDPDAARSFIQNQIGTLLAYDRTNGTQMAYTLYVYLGCPSGRLAADRLYVHYNTLKYRLNIIRNLVSPEGWDNPTDRLATQLALELNFVQGWSPTRDPVIQEPKSMPSAAKQKADSLVENRPSELYAIRDSNPGPTD